MTLRIPAAGRSILQATNLANIMALHAGFSGARFHHSEKVPGASRTWVYKAV